VTGQNLRRIGEGKEGAEATPQGGKKRGGGGYPAGKRVAKNRNIFCELQEHKRGIKTESSAARVGPGSVKTARKMSSKEKGGPHTEQASQVGKIVLAGKKRQAARKIDGLRKSGIRRTGGKKISKDKGLTGASSSLPNSKACETIHRKGKGNNVVCKNNFQINVRAGKK